jgi:hypothetical protein
MRLSPWSSRREDNARFLDCQGERVWVQSNGKDNSKSEIQGFFSFDNAQGAEWRLKTSNCKRNDREVKRKDRAVGAVFV